MKPCCEAEAKSSLRRHRDVAVCDGCGWLVIAYGVERDYLDTVAELERHAVEHHTGQRDRLWLIAKARA